MKGLRKRFDAQIEWKTKHNKVRLGERLDIVEWRRWLLDRTKEVRRNAETQANKRYGTLSSIFMEKCLKCTFAALKPLIVERLFSWVLYHFSSLKLRNNIYPFLCSHVHSNAI